LINKNGEELIKIIGRPEEGAEGDIV